MVANTLPAWVLDYRGIPFVERGRDRAGCDCWGLLRLVYAERYGVELPSYAEGYASTAEVRAIARLTEEGRAAWTEVAEPAPGDAVLFRIEGSPRHVGVVPARGWVLHAEPGVGVVWERYEEPIWQPRILGFYRHGALSPSVTQGVTASSQVSLRLTKVTVAPSPSGAQSTCA